MYFDDNQNGNSGSSENSRDESTYVPIRDTSEGQVRTGNSDDLVTKRTQ